MLLIGAITIDHSDSPLSGYLYCIEMHRVACRSQDLPHYHCPLFSSLHFSVYHRDTVIVVKRNTPNLSRRLQELGSSNWFHVCASACDMCLDM